VTGAFVLTGRIPIGTGLVYLVAQLGGASLAAFFLAAAFPEAVRKVAVLGTPTLNPNITAGVGIIVEAILTFFLVFAVFGTAVDGRGPRMGGLFIGLALTMAILVGGALTGAALNPARAFGPALFSGMWGNHLVYWIGPIIGGALAGWIYHAVFTPS
jgi:glycerol uptake facilitator-like aquaporin